MVRKVSRNSIAVTVLAGIVLVLFVATVAGLLYYRKMIKELNEVQEEVYEEYTRLYAYIAEDPDSKLSKKIYKAFCEYARDNGCYVEMTGQNLSTNYSKADRINIAISSKVDGIILEGDNSEETRELIDKAWDNGIPVVTVLSDNKDSKRISFVGLNDYSVGAEYGKALAELRARDNKQPLTALILLDAEERNYDDMIHTAIIQEASGRYINLSSEKVNTSTPFASEEDVMNKLDALTSMPDVIICLNDRTTESVIQYIVDKNLVGKTTILGYSDTETILKAINKGSVYATVAIEANVLARQCVDALNEYNNNNAEYVSDYFVADYVLINQGNLDSYDPEGSNEGG